MATNKAIIASVGQRVSEERRARKLRLTDLSRESGISISMLSKFENGKISLNFRHLVEIARVLNVPVSCFVDNEKVEEPSGRRSVTRNDQGYLQSTDRIDFEILCDDLAHRYNIFWKARVKCRSVKDYGEFSSHPGEEFILVLEGAIDLHTAAYKPLRLEKGDSVHFDATTPHAYIAISDEVPVILISNTTPRDFAELPGSLATMADEEV